MSDSKVKISNILESQLPEFILDDNPLFKEFLEQYYLSQQHEYGTVDLAEKIHDLKNIESFVDLKFTATTPKLTKFIANADDVIEVTNHLGFVPKNGLVKISDEIFTYTGKSSFAQKVIAFDFTANTITLSSTVGLDSFRAQTIIFDTAFSNIVAGQVYFVTEVINANTITISDDENALDDVYSLTDTNPLASNATAAAIRGIVASAVATESNLSGGELTGNVTLTAGGSGYSVPPAVTVSGGGGSGGIATASVRDGKVVSIALSGGSGYTSEPTIEIGEPTGVILTITHPGFKYDPVKTYNVTVSGGTTLNGFSGTLIVDKNGEVSGINVQNYGDYSDFTDISAIIPGHGAELPTITSFAFTGCIRGFSGIDSVGNSEFINFNISQTQFHDAGTPLTNLGLVFLAEFFRKYKKMFLPGIEDRQFQSVNIDNILARARDFYSSKGTDTSLKILFAVLFGKSVEVLKPFDNTILSSGAEFSLSDVVIVESVEGDVEKLAETTILQGSVDNPTAKGIVSRVERLTSNGKYYYKLFFPKDTIENKFHVSKNTRVLGVGITDTTLTVDSTIGFPESGSFVNPDSDGLIEVSYTSKSANQFFGCVGLSTSLVENDPITDGNYTFGYEDNDITKLVTMRVVGSIVGVADNRNTTSQFRKGDALTVKHLGEKVEETDVRFNRWFYNNVVITSVRKVIGSSSLQTEVDHHLNVGDRVDILLENNKSVVDANCRVDVVINRREVTFTGNSTFDVNTRYLIKKRLDFVNANLNTDGVLSNIQNTFVDTDKNAYVAFSGLPGYDNVTTTDRSKTFDGDDVIGDNQITITNHNFKNGEQLYFETTSGISTVVTGNYFAHIVDPNTIKLAFSRASLDDRVYVGIASGTSSEHKLTPASLYQKKLSNQNNLRRIYKNPKQATEHNDIIGPIGVALNGVEFQSPVSNDSIYYGQVDKINVLNAGTGYDVINAPEIGIGDTKGSSGSLLMGHFKGKVEDVILNSPGFNYADTPSVTISGGNGTQAIAEARMRGFNYSITFVDNARDNQESDIITFADGHRFSDGEQIIYSTTGTPVGVGSTSVGFSTDRLTPGAVYYIAKINDTQLSLATSKEKALAKTVINMNAFGNGTHKLLSRVKRRIIDRINIIKSTDDFSNRKVIVDAVAWPPADQKDIYKSFVGVNTESNYIYARNHSFKTGDNVQYSFDGTTIDGLTTSANYKVTVLDDDRFTLSEAGTATTISSVNFNNKIYVDITTVGVGTHTFQYPPITMAINGVVSTGNTSVTPSYYNASGVPVVRGSLENVFIRNGGVGYGVSDVMNYQRDIDVEVKTGREASAKAIIVNGKITSVYLANPGLNYTSPPTINVIGSGTLAKLTPTIVNGSITAVNIINQGQDYGQDTVIEVVPTGADAKLNAEVHQWTFNNVERYKVALQLDNPGIAKKDRLNREMVQINSGSSLKESKLVSFYAGAHYRQIMSDNLDTNGDEILTGFSHSPILGWAYDGNPIYGPYGHAVPLFREGESSGGIKKIFSGYVEDTETSTLLRPPGFPAQTFTQDFVYKASGDLDEYNGRFCKTPEFPNGTYAYFSSLDFSKNLAYPYITKSHYNETDQFNYNPLIDQGDKTLNDGSFRRNVTHLGMNDPYREYTFAKDSMLSKAKINVNEVKSSRINDIIVLKSGIDYKVGEQINFNDPSIDVEVEQVLGENIVSIGTSDTVLENTIFSVQGNVVTGVTTTPHGFFDGDIIEVSGIGSASYKNLEGFPAVGVGTVLTKMSVAVAATTATGISTVISLNASTFTENFVQDDIIKIGNELMRIVGVDLVNNRYKVTRIVNDSAGSTHNVGDLVIKQPVTFTFLLDKKVENKNASLPYKQNFARSAVGIGATYTSVVVGTAGSTNITVSIPDRAIFVPGHKFKSGEQLSITSIGGTVFASAKSDLTGAFSIETTDLFAVNIGSDFLGIATSKAFVGINSTLYFHGSTNGDNHTIAQVKDNITGIVKKVSARVQTSKAHALKAGDDVRLQVTPNKVQQFAFKFNPVLKKLVVDPKTFAPAGITTVTTSEITVPNHGLNTGDLVAYVNAVGVATPLQNNTEYYAIKINDNKFRLAENKSDALAFPYQNLTITEQGLGTHEIAKVNPKLDIINGGRFALNTSDTSLFGFDINFYHDNEFQSRYESTLIKRDGVIGDGVATTQIIVNINKDLPSNLYYRLEGDDTNFTDTYPSSADITVENYSNLHIVESKFNQNYKVASIGVGTDYSFGFTVVGAAETTSYTSAGYSTAFYSTSSPTAIGGIHSAKVVNDGINIKKFPAVTSIGTTTGVGAELELTKSEIGQIIDGIVYNPGVEFSEDTTITPKVNSSLVLRLSNIRTLKSVGVVTSGNDYNVPPQVVALESDNSINNSIVTQTILSGGGVSEVEVVSSDSNLKEDLRIIPINNSNGIGVVGANSSNGVNELLLKAPQVGGGFGANFPFQKNDQIFVENVQITNPDLADGYNSSDYEYRFFTISDTNTIAGVESISYRITGFGFTGGTYNIAQNAQFGRIIKVEDLATFIPEFATIKFTEGEKVIDAADPNVFGFVAKNGWDEESGILRLDDVNGNFTENSIVRGIVGNFKATISEVNEFDFDLDVGSVSSDAGVWLNDVGKLSDSLQRLHDNDYYQRFSYAIRGEIELDKWKETVDSLDHTAGYKNFSDLQIITEPLPIAKVSIGDTEFNVKIDINSKSSVWTRLSYDLASEDTDSTDISKIIKFDSKIITDYNESRTNKVLMIDDISPQFNGVGNSAGQTVGLSTFSIFTEGNSLLHHSVNPATGIAVSTITVTEHNFNSGEELLYDPTNAGINTGSRLSIVSTTVAGVATDRLPDQVFAITFNVDPTLTKNTFKVAVSKADALAGISVTFTNTIGIGLTQSFSTDSDLANTRSLITIDNIVQSPIAVKPVGVAITMSEAVGVGSTQITVSNVSKIQGKSLLRFPSGEIVKVDLVGVGATNVLNVTRGAMGTVAVAHTVGTASSVITGDYRIKQGKIYLSDAPYGPAGIGGVTTKSTFQGRIFYRLQYSENLIFDDISDSFDGSSDQFSIISSGVAVTGITTSHGAVLINNIFQKPFLSPIGALANADYQVVKTLTGEDLDFTGVEKVGDLPQGGIINEFVVGVGSGYQVPTRAIGAAVVNGSGVLTGVTVGIGSTGIRSGGAGHIFAPNVYVVDPLGVGVGASVRATIGAAGTVTGFTVLVGGSGYTQATPPQVFTDEPAPYKNLKLTGGVGAGASMDVVVGTGGSIIKFNMSNRGIGYEEGDVLTLSGLPFQTGTATADFTVTVSNKYQDKFSGWTFGQLLEMDDFSNQFNGFKTQFLITRTEIDKEFYSIVAQKDSGIILQNNLLVFLNDVLQKPGVDYEFTGGTRFKFTEAPKAGSNFRLYLYTGSDEDFFEVDVDQTVKEGDELRLQYFDNNVSQDRRTIYALIAADTVETETYTGVGINSDGSFLRPVEWTKQTSDLIIDGLRISKARNSYSSRYFPTTNIIHPVAPTDSVIYAENVWAFDEVDNRVQSLNNVTIVDAIGVGLTIPVVETLKEVTYEGDFGQVTDITDFAAGDTGAVNSLPTIKFDIYPHPSIYSDGGDPNTVQKTGISTGDYFVIRNTCIGSAGAGVTSIDGSQSNIVAVGSSFLDNVYRAAAVTAIGGTDTIRVSTNIHSITGINTDPEFGRYGTFSWGKINTGGRNGQSLGFQSHDPLSGVTTSAHVSRTTRLKSQY